MPLLKSTGEKTRAGVWGIGLKPVCCVVCQTKDRPHFAKGKCKSCYHKHLKKKKAEMGRCILKLPGRDKFWYLIWSTVADAPVTYGMTLDELREYIREKEGASGLRDLPERLARCDAHGTSSLISSLEGLVECNRAGPGETNLSLEQIVEAYCKETS